MKNSGIISLIVAIIMIFSLTSCIEINVPSDKENDPHNNTHDNYQPPEEDESDESTQGGEGNVTYVYSVLSKTLHLPGCYHTGRMNEDYKFEYTGDIAIMLGKGYTICKDCLVPDEEKEEEEEPEEDENLIAKEDANYAYNKVSLVIHTLDCHHLEIMIEKNLRYTDLTIEELLELEYRPCGACMPDEYKEYKKNHPEEE